MPVLVSDRILESVRSSAIPLTGGVEDFDTLLELAGGARLVLLGEATHGTHEFYKARAEITKRLIQEKGFNAVCWEADWPDALRVNRYVRGGNHDQTTIEALGGFQRFPTWMWRNADILDLVGWLRDYNRKASSKVGVYGLDLYSLHSSMAAVVNYLQKTDPAAAEVAKRRYACFEDFGDDPQSYGMTAAADKSLSCEEEVVQQLMELQRKSCDYLKQDGAVAADELFYAEQNARVALNAEHYYRAMYRGRPNTWNLRDTHMADTLDQIVEHLDAQGSHARAVIWAHNSHLGDARATEMGRRGELNLGQLVRERHPEESLLVGFTTFSGTVTAANDWGDPPERKRVRPGLSGSYEELMHEVGIPNFFLPLRGSPAERPLKKEYLERAIGVIYRPETERWSHYFRANLSDQFDAIIHYDETRAVEPLERNQVWEKGEMPETYPSGY